MIQPLEWGHNVILQQRQVTETWGAHPVKMLLRNRRKAGNHHVASQITKQETMY
jgi:hypothetical protein